MTEKWPGQPVSRTSQSSWPGQRVESKPKAVTPSRAVRGTKRAASTEVAQFLNEVNRSIPLMDELQAGLEVGRQTIGDIVSGRKGVSLGDKWSRARAQQEAMSQDLNTRRPNAAAFTRGTGGAAPAVAAAAVTGGGSLAPQVVGGVRGALLPYAQAASAATAGGALTRLTDKGTLQQRLASASDPGSIAMDAALGAGIQGGGEVVKNLLNRRPKAVTPRQRASRVVAKTKAAPVSEQQAAQGTMPFEQVGPKGMTLARAVASVPGEGQNIANVALRTRAQAAPARMNAAVNDTLGNGQAYYSTIDDLMTKRKTEAAPLYDEAYRVGIFPDDFNAQVAPILDTPAGQQALRNAVNIAKNERVPINNLGITIDDNAGTIRFDAVPNMKTLDYVRRGFDDVVEGARDKVTGKLNPDNATRAVLGLRRDLNDSLIALNPKYGEALNAWSGPTKAIDAMTRGRKLASGRTDPEVFSGVVGRMGDAEKEAMRIGVARTLSDRLRGRNPQSEIRAITSDMNYQSRLREAFPDQRGFDNFMNQANTEATYQGNMNQVLSGSRTTPLREDIDAINAQLDESGIGGRILDVVEQRAGGKSFVRQSVEAAISKVAQSGQRGLNDPEVSRILGEALFTDPRLFNQLLIEQARIMRIPPEELSRLVIASATASPSLFRQPPQANPATPY
jgi:hypothetical protein